MTTTGTQQRDESLSYSDDDDGPENVGKINANAKGGEENDEDAKPRNTLAMVDRDLNSPRRYFEKAIFSQASSSILSALSTFDEEGVEAAIQAGIEGSHSGSKHLSVEESKSDYPSDEDKKPKTVATTILASQGTIQEASSPLADASQTGNWVSNNRTLDIFRNMADCDQSTVRNASTVSSMSDVTSPPDSENNSDKPLRVVEGGTSASVKSLSEALERKISHGTMGRSSEEEEKEQEGTKSVRSISESLERRISVCSTLSSAKSDVGNRNKGDDPSSRLESLKGKRKEDSKDETTRETQAVTSKIKKLQRQISVSSAIASESNSSTTDARNDTAKAQPLKIQSAAQAFEGKECQANLSTIQDIEGKTNERTSDHDSVKRLAEAITRFMSSSASMDSTEQNSRLALAQESTEQNPSLDKSSIAKEHVSMGAKMSEPAMSQRSTHRRPSFEEVEIPSECVNTGDKPAYPMLPNISPVETVPPLVPVLATATTNDKKLLVTQEIKPRVAVDRADRSSIEKDISQENVIEVSSVRNEHVKQIGNDEVSQPAGKPQWSIGYERAYDVWRRKGLMKPKDSVTALVERIDKKAQPNLGRHKQGHLEIVKETCSSTKIAEELPRDEVVESLKQPETESSNNEAPNSPTIAQANYFPMEETKALENEKDSVNKTGDKTPKKGGNHGKDRRQTIAAVTPSDLPNCDSHSKRRQSLPPTNSQGKGKAFSSVLEKWKAKSENRPCSHFLSPEQSSRSTSQPRSRPIIDDKGALEVHERLRRARNLSRPKERRMEVMNGNESPTVTESHVPPVRASSQPQPIMDPDERRSCSQPHPRIGGSPLKNDVDTNENDALDPGRKATQKRSDTTQASASVQSRNTVPPGQITSSVSSALDNGDPPRPINTARSTSIPQPRVSIDKEQAKAIKTKWSEEKIDVDIPARKKSGGKSKSDDSRVLNSSAPKDSKSNVPQTEVEVQPKERHPAHSTPLADVDTDAPLSPVRCEPKSQMSRLIQQQQQSDSKRRLRQSLPAASRNFQTPPKARRSESTRNIRSHSTLRYGQDAISLASRLSSISKATGSRYTRHSVDSAGFDQRSRSLPRSQRSESPSTFSPNVSMVSLQTLAVMSANSRCSKNSYTPAPENRLGSLPRMRELKRDEHHFDDITCDDSAASLSIPREVKISTSARKEKAETDFLSPFTQRVVRSLEKVYDEALDIRTPGEQAFSERPWRRDSLIRRALSEDSKPDAICHCSCADSVFSNNDDMINFFLPLMGAACTCGQKQKGLNIPDDPTSLVNILRPWQAEFLGAFGIFRGEELVKAHHRSASALARALRQYRKRHNMTPFRTKSCGTALQIWSKTSKAFVRSIRSQMNKGENGDLRAPNALYIVSSFLDNVPSDCISQGGGSTTATSSISNHTADSEWSSSVSNTRSTRTGTTGKESFRSSEAEI